MEALRAAVREKEAAARPLDRRAAEQVVAFCNEYLSDALLPLVLSTTDVGRTAASKNMWSGGAWVPKAARLTAIDLKTSALQVAVDVKERGKDELTRVTTELLPPDAPFATVDQLRSGLLRLVDEETPAAGSVMLRLPGATDSWSLPDDLWLNNCPYRRSVSRNWGVG